MKPWFRRFKRAVELHFTGSTVHTSRADACADSALIAFSSSPSFDPAANSVAQGLHILHRVAGELAGVTLGTGGRNYLPLLLLWDMLCGWDPFVLFKKGV